MAAIEHGHFDLQHTTDHEPAHEAVEDDHDLDQAEEELIAAKIVQLDAEDPQVVATAAEALFSRSHVSHPTFAKNKERMRSMGAIPALCRALQSHAWPVKYHACSALSELAFCNKNNCIAIVKTPGALNGLVNILLSNVLNMHEDAALVVNNCAAFSEEVCMTIVRSPGMVASLKKLATSGSFGTKCVAVGAINCLSRCKEARLSLNNMRVVEDALVPVLNEQGAGDKYEARKVRAAMAVANLTGRCDPEHVNDYEALPAMVKVLGYALEGRSWAGIHLSAYSVLYPLSHLAEQASNRPLLIACGLVELLARSVERWVEGLRSDADDLTLPLVLKISDLLAQDLGAHERMRAAGMLHGLREVARGVRGETVQCMWRAEVLLERLLLAPLAVCMGQHSRVGAASPFFKLDEYVTAQIIEFAFEAGCVTSTAGESSTSSLHSSSSGGAACCPPGGAAGMDDHVLAVGTPATPATPATPGLPLYADSEDEMLLEGDEELQEEAETDWMEMQVAGSDFPATN